MSSHTDSRVDRVVLSNTGHKEYLDRIEGQTVQPVRAGQRVKVEGRDEVYMILRVDRVRHLADLLREGRVRKVESGVPLALLRVVGEPETVSHPEMSA